MIALSNVDRKGSVLENQCTSMENLMKFYEVDHAECRFVTVKLAFGCLLVGQAILVFSGVSLNRMRGEKNKRNKY